MTLETQYKNYKISNPESKITFDEWKVMLGKKLEESIKQINLINKNNKDDNRDIKKLN